MSGTPSRAVSKLKINPRTTVSPRRCFSYCFSQHSHNIIRIPSGVSTVRMIKKIWGTSSVSGDTIKKRFPRGKCCKRRKKLPNGREKTVRICWFFVKRGGFTEDNFFLISAKIKNSHLRSHSLRRRERHAPPKILFLINIITCVCATYICKCNAWVRCTKKILFSLLLLLLFYSKIWLWWCGLFFAWQRQIKTKIFFFLCVNYLCTKNMNVFKN